MRVQSVRQLTVQMAHLVNLVAVVVVAEEGQTLAEAHPAQEWQVEPEEFLAVVEEVLAMVVQEVLLVPEAVAKFVFGVGR